MSTLTSGIQVDEEQSNKRLNSILLTTETIQNDQSDQEQKLEFAKTSGRVGTNFLADCKCCMFSSQLELCGCNGYLLEMDHRCLKL